MVLCPKAVITNQLTKVGESWLKDHHIRHLVSGCIVFCLGVAMDIIIVEYQHDKPYTVLWKSGEVQKGYHLKPVDLPPVGSNVELGFVSNGSIIWRKK